MLDIKYVRENPDAIDTAMAHRQTSWDREHFFALDEERRSVIAEVEQLQATRNAESKKIGVLMREGKRDEAEAAKEAVREVNEKIEGLAARFRCVKIGRGGAGHTHSLRTLSSALKALRLLSRCHLPMCVLGSRRMVELFLLTFPFHYLFVSSFLYTFASQLKNTLNIKYV